MTIVTVEGSMMQKVSFRTVESGLPVFPVQTCRPTGATAPAGEDWTAARWMRVVLSLRSRRRRPASIDGLSAHLLRDIGLDSD